MGLSTMTMLKMAKNVNGVIITDSLRKKVQSILLMIIKDIDDICTEHDIFYCLCGGSALGAVRHNGFIPWDDDIDICMTRASYEKFLKCYKEKFGEKYTLHSPETTPELGMPIAQLSLNGTIYRTQLAPNRENPGIFIDIFVLEDVPNNTLMRYFHGFCSLFTGLALSSSRFYKDRERVIALFKDSQPELLETLNKKIFIGKIFATVLPVSQWCKMNRWINSLYHDDSSKYVSIPSGRKHYFGEMQLRKDMCETTMVRFEDIYLPVMKGYHEYFTSLYGATYMTPPKDADKEVHSIIELDFGEF